MCVYILSHMNIYDAHICKCSPNCNKSTSLILFMDLFLIHSNLFKILFYVVSLIKRYLVLFVWNCLPRRYSQNNVITLSLHRYSRLKYAGC